MRTLCLILTLTVMRAALIDSIAVTVGTQAITESQIDEQIRLAAFTNHSDPVFTPESRKKAADELVEQALIRREMSFGTYPPIPETQIESALASTSKANDGETA